MKQFRKELSKSFPPRLMDKSSLLQRNRTPTPSCWSWKTSSFYLPRLNRLETLPQRSVNILLQSIISLRLK